MFVLVLDSPSLCRELIKMTRKSTIKFVSKRYLSTEITLLHDGLVLCIILQWYVFIDVKSTQQYIIIHKEMFW